MHWSTPFVGLPWRVRGRSLAGVDCWGLCYLAWRANDIAAPSYADDYVDDRETAEIQQLMVAEVAGGPWRPVAPGDERSFDVILLRMAGVVSHCGLVVEPGRMLHIEVDRESRIVNYRDGRWCRRIDGIYRLAQ
ncbi:C40 family peptidase [Nitrobacteraceae bacterium UC4446_H13]